MAKKNQPKDTPEKRGLSQPQGFTHGMVSDLDPHFQLKGSYSDAQNIRLTNSEGDTFTVENIEGNSLFIDLANYPISVNIGEGAEVNVSDYPTFYDRGPNLDVTTNLKLDNRCSIVGHYSYANQLLLIIVGRFEYDRNNVYSDGNPANMLIDRTDRTIFLMVDFDENFEVKKVSDLRVCYKPSKENYPDLGMKLDVPVRVEAIVENDSISRIYWTDNVNPLKTLNLKQSRLDLLPITSLDITPLMKPSQPVLNTTLHGSLPVGVYQYSYKLVSENGGESTFSPLSNMYHVSDQSFSNSNTYGGGPKGNLGTQGFNIKVSDIDEDFEYIELYALLYEDLNSPPKVALVNRNKIAGPSSTFQHVNFSNQIESGLEEVLIESNTWDVCKDIAIKDNILFAANLRQKQNYISEKEWNVKVLRWRIAPGSSNRLDAMLTTNDPQVKHYQDTGSGPVEINTSLYQYSVTDDENHRCGYGELLGATGSMYDAASNDFMNYDGSLNNPMWTLNVSGLRYGLQDTTSTSDNRFTGAYAYRFLSDRKTLGGESFNYTTNDLGGCRVSFGVEERVADQAQNASSSPFISATSDGKEFSTERTDIAWDGLDTYDTGSTTFKTSMSLGGSKDPHAAGDKRGYQRGEVYRFGVQVYDLKGAPGNVLWIGDIQTPDQFDLLRMIDIKGANDGNGSPYSPAVPSIDGWGTTGLQTRKCVVSHPRIQDHRLSHIYGHVVPPADIEWFTERNGGTTADLTAYINDIGNQINGNLLPGGTSNWLYPSANGGGINKALPKYENYQISNVNERYGYKDENHTDTHYLYDMYVAFEFMIPDEVVKKISGFRVVRAVRTEEDKRIVQQGLLNQTAKYGDAKRSINFGYGKTRFCRKDNEAFSDDPVFVNEYNDQTNTPAIDPTLPEQPEYDTYLNGYLGLAENSFLAFYDNAETDGKVTTGGNTAGKVYTFPEREDSKQWGGDTAETVRGVVDAGANANYGGPNTYGVHRRHSAYFGSWDKFSNQYSANSSSTDSQNYQGEEIRSYRDHKHISGSIFTLDAPDSAFGIRPYSYREGDYLRIDCVLKLSDERRYENHPDNWGGTTGVYADAFHSYCRTRTTEAISPNFAGNVPNTTVGDTAAVQTQWGPVQKDLNINAALSFCTRQDLDNDYSVLVGKYYCFDPYWAVGMEVTGGKFMGDDHGAAAWGPRRPRMNYGWLLPIAASKEITDGEIVPNGFFKHANEVKQGQVHGFSNNTLGYTKLAVVSKKSGSTDYTDDKQYFVFDAVNQKIAHINNASGGSANQYADVLEEDYTYDTISTMQMGLRSILIEVDNRAKHVRLKGADSSHFMNIATYGDVKYHHWFAPLNLGAYYEHGEWRSTNRLNIHGGTSGDYGHDHLPVRNGFLTHQFEGAADVIDTKDHGSDSWGVKLKDDNGRSLVPYKYLCSIVRRVVPYGGYSKGAIERTRYIPCGNFHKVNAEDTVNSGDLQRHVSQVFGGDTFVNLYSHQKTSSPYMRKSAARWQVFPVESYVNTDMRSGLTLNAGDTVVGKNINEPPLSNDWLYNSIYSQENNLKSAIAVDEETFNDSLNLPYEIAYSNTKILGQRSDAFRQFPINQFHDMEGLYGEINRIINFKNEIYVLQDTAFAKLLVNPLSMLSDDTGTSLFTGTGETVENHIYISTKYGTRHRFSVAQSEKSLYFVDSSFARLFKYDTEKLISLGDALGQRNYLKYIIKEWEKRAYRVCPDTNNFTFGVPLPGNLISMHGNNTATHGIAKGQLDSVYKPFEGRNYLSDNPLRFLGITSIYDFKNKELLVTFHNSYFGPYPQDTLRRANLWNNENHFSTDAHDGTPAGISQTLVYSEAINAFTSKYSVAPPQWLIGGQGSFLVCPENEMDIINIGQFSATTGSSDDMNNAITRVFKPLNLFGNGHTNLDRNYRCNPLRLWLWDKHESKKKTHFFGKKDDWLKKQDTTMLNGGTNQGWNVYHAGTGDVPDESYIEKVINTEAANSKVFDNAEIVMTPGDVPFSNIKYLTDISHDTLKIYSQLTSYTEPVMLDEEEELVINKRWDFNGTINGWFFYDGSSYPAPVINTTSITLNCNGDARFRSPYKGDQIDLIGKYNNKIRMRVKRTSNTSSTDWEGKILWQGYDIIEKEKGNYSLYGEDGTRAATIDEPLGTGDFGQDTSGVDIVGGIDLDFVILEWDMSDPTINNDVDAWENSLIHRIRIDLSGDTGAATFEVDWIEIGGLKAHKYIDGILKLPLRTEKSKRRTRGTYAKIKYSAKTTEKFNIFAILAKYRKTY
tara:strand:+ start:4196 stop:11014 length:6819 start_codon:yes stop_codon:yes gene_type:complete